MPIKVKDLFSSGEEYKSPISKFLNATGINSRMGKVLKVAGDKNREFHSHDNF